jgi:hypothetical protein
MESLSASMAPIEEVVDEDLVVGHQAQDVEHLGLELVLIDHDLHLLPAEHVAGAHQQREAEGARWAMPSSAVLTAPKAGYGMLRSRSSDEKRPAVLGHVQRGEAGADDLDAVLLQVFGQLQRGLPAELHDDALGCSSRMIS